MAIYHLEAKVISRGVGRSAVAASAYMSCSRIYNDCDGIQHDYTRKQGLVYEQILLPPQEPPEWKDRSVLWNAVEETEKTKDSRLAREFVVALPTELSKGENISLLTEYVQSNFVDDGMCADFCIHDTDGHNPHAHIMLTVRPLDENGKWQSKTEKEYLCIKDDEERGFTSAEFKTAQLDGWEKQYQYIVGKKKVYMPSSQAEAQGYERASKYPKSTRYGRQNPIAERWNSEEQLLIWRKNWADINNLYLARKNIDSRIDHRSHKERGLDEQPTIHEGVTAIIIEQKGGTSERCEINRQIKADNKLFRELKETLKKLAQAVIDTLPKLADAIETMRKNIMIAAYHMLHSRYRKEAVGDKIKTTTDNIQKYDNTLSRLKAKVKDKKATSEKKKATSVLNIPKQRELAKILITQTEEIEELKTEKGMLLNKLNCENGSEVAELKKHIPQMEKALHQYEKQEGKYQTELNNALAEFFDTKENTQNVDEFELVEERLRIRPQKEKEFNEYVNTCGIAINPKAFTNVIADTDNMLLKEDLLKEKNSILNKLRKLQYRQKQEQLTERRQKQHNRDDWDMEL